MEYQIRAIILTWVIGIEAKQVALAKVTNLKQELVESSRSLRAALEAKSKLDEMA